MMMTHMNEVAPPHEQDLLPITWTYNLYLYPDLHPHPLQIPGEPRRIRLSGERLGKKTRTRNSRIRARDARQCLSTPTARPRPGATALGFSIGTADIRNLFRRWSLLSLAGFRRVLPAHAGQG